jgi:hypothetical protein
MARPIPREAPVMTPTLPVRSCSRSCNETIVEIVQMLGFGMQASNLTWAPLDYSRFCAMILVYLPGLVSR